jgi:hypothetical protein
VPDENRFPQNARRLEIKIVFHNYFRLPFFIEQKFRLPESGENRRRLIRRFYDKTNGMGAARENSLAGHG